jgi:hypothetical protein
MIRHAAVTLLSLAVAAPLPARDTDKRAKPHLDLRLPAVAGFAPARVTLTAELVGGEDSEELYCTAVEWDWGDGERSSRESDCPPFVPGAAVERRFSARHEYSAPGAYQIRLTMSRAGARVTDAATTFTVHPGLRGAHSSF